MKLSELKRHCSNLGIDYVEFCLSRFGMEMLEQRYKAFKSSTAEQTASYQALQRIRAYRKRILLLSVNDFDIHSDAYKRIHALDLRKALYLKEMGWDQTTTADNDASVSQLVNTYQGTKLQSIYEQALVVDRDERRILSEGILKEKEKIFMNRVFLLAVNMLKDNLDDFIYKNLQEDVNQCFDAVFHP